MGRLRARPDDVVALTQLSWVYLALGRGSDAVGLARKAADFVSIDRDAFGGLPFAIGLAQVYAQVGNAGEAVNILRRLLSIPRVLSFREPSSCTRWGPDPQ